jgi:hypothetical protein
VHTDLIKIRHPSVRIAVPLEEIKKRFAQEELEKEIEKYFPRHLLQPGKCPSPRSPRSDVGPSVESAKSSSPTSAATQPAAAGDRESDNAERADKPEADTPPQTIAADVATSTASGKGDMVDYVSKLKKSNERPNTFGFNAVPTISRTTEGPNSMENASKSGNSFRLGSYRRERDSGTTNGDAESDKQAEVSTDADKRDLRLSSSSSGTRADNGASAAAADTHGQEKAEPSRTINGAHLDFIREEFGGVGGGSRRESVDESGVVTDGGDVETNEAELQRMELRYRLQADREASEEGKPKYARKVGVLYKKERNGDKWFGCKFVLGKYSLKYFKIRADWVRITPCHTTLSHTTNARLTLAHAHAQETAEALGEISLVRARVDCCPHGKDKGFCFVVQSPVETAFLAADREDVLISLFLSHTTLLSTVLCRRPDSDRCVCAHSQGLKDWLEAILGCIRDLPLALRWSFRRDDSLVKAQSEVCSCSSSVHTVCEFVCVCVCIRRGLTCVRLDALNHS